MEPFGVEPKVEPKSNVVKPDCWNTGRVNANQPETQQIPIRTEQGNLLRNALGEVFGMHEGGADFSKIEAHVFANLTNPETELDGVTKLEDGTILDSITGEVLYSPHTPLNSMTLGEKLEYVFDCKMQVTDLEAQITKIKTEFAKFEYEILEEMQEKDLEKIECSRGSATSKTEPYPNISDHLAFFDWVAENKAYEFLEKRCSRAAIKDKLSNEGILPPGINTYLKTSLSVRKKAVRRNK